MDWPVPPSVLTYPSSPSSSSSSSSSTFFSSSNSSSSSSSNLVVRHTSSSTAIILSLISSTSFSLPSTSPSASGYPGMSTSDQFPSSIFVLSLNHPSHTQYLSFIC